MTADDGGVVWWVVDEESGEITDVPAQFEVGGVVVVDEVVGEVEVVPVEAFVGGAPGGVVG